MAELHHFTSDTRGRLPAAVLREAVMMLRFAYLAFLLIFFLAAFTTSSVPVTRCHANTTSSTTGLRGKTLPATELTRNSVNRAVPTI
jgi:hypothetical protein